MLDQLDETISDVNHIREMIENIEGKQMTKNLQQDITSSMSQLSQNVAAATQLPQAIHGAQSSSVVDKSTAKLSKRQSVSILAKDRQDKKGGHSMRL